jgi:hypothetical protein
MKKPHMVNDVSQKRVKYQFQILYIMSYKKITKKVDLNIHFQISKRYQFVIFV